jgi:hypothetical protein
VICLLAYTYLAVAVAVQRQQEAGAGLDARLIPITVRELLRLLRDTGDEGRRCGAYRSRPPVHLAAVPHHGDSHRAGGVVNVVDDPVVLPRLLGYGGHPLARSHE